MLRSSIVSLTAAMLLIPGCGADATEPLIPGVEPLDLRQPELVANAARNSDPLSILLLSTITISAQEPAPEGGETGCPRIIDESDYEAQIVSWRVEGGCTREDADGQTRVEGSIVGRGDASGTVVEYLGYSERTLSTYQCVGQATGTDIDGVFRFSYAFMPFAPEEEEEQPEQPSTRRTDRYEIDIRIESSGTDEACSIEKTELAYDLVLDRTYEYSNTTYDESDLSDMDGRIAVRMQVQEMGQDAWQTIWNAAWRVAAEGYGQTSGDDETCFDHITGTLRLEAGGDEAVLQPSLPESCLDNQDEEGPACTAWTLNGKAQPELCGFVGLSGCSAGPNAPPPWMAMFLLVGGLMWQNRRRRRARA